MVCLAQDRDSRDGSETSLVAAPLLHSEEALSSMQLVKFISIVN
jgi:hypothetical protein